MYRERYQNDDEIDPTVEDEDLMMTIGMAIVLGLITGAALLLLVHLAVWIARHA